MYFVSLSLYPDTTLKCECREIFASVAYLDVIERCESIFVQLYNIKSIPSAASENHHRVKRKIRREGEIERMERGGRRRGAMRLSLHTTMYENVMLRETINIMCIGYMVNTDSRDSRYLKHTSCVPIKHTQFKRLVRSKCKFSKE